MRAGNLDRTIVIQRRDTRVNDAGTVVDAPGWADLASVRAELLAPAIVTGTAPTAFNAVESDRAYGAAEEAVLTFRLRYLDGITTADRLQYAGSDYDITGTTEIGRRRGLLIRCRLVS